MAYLSGNSVNNYIVGTLATDVINGAHGNDTLLSGIGDDSVFGSDGDDFIFNDFGNDRRDGGTGRGPTGSECCAAESGLVLLRGGPGVFGIATGGVWREIEGSLHELPSELAMPDSSDRLADDELAARRRARQSS